MEQIQITWALILITVVPLCSIGLGEIVSRLRSHPLMDLFYSIRVFTLPPLVILLVALKLFHVPTQDIKIQVISTVLGLAIIHSLIALINGILVSGNRQHSWQIAVPNLLFQVARVSVILCVASYLLATVWHVDLSKVIAALGVGSLVIALALQDTLSNLVSGFLLIFESPFQVGDWVRVNDVEGEVLEVNWRAVRLKTPDHDVVIIPNGVLGKETIYNYTLLYPLHGDRITFTFSNEEAPNRVIPVLKTAALAVEGILADPEPEVRPLKFTDHQAEYEVQYCIADFTHASTIQGQFITNVYYAAKRHQLMLPMPLEKHYVLQEHPSHGQDHVPDILKALAALPIFRVLDETVLNTLAHQAEVKYYGVGETITHAGDVDEGICILLQGQVILSCPDHTGHIQVISHLEMGDLFGEMSLLRNEPSLVSVTALQDVELVVLNGDVVFSVAQQQSNFALEMNHFIDERKKMVQRSTESGLEPVAMTSQATIA
ncbi:MAG: mechanosensitive ion channel [Leptolyngbya sp. SIO3F4]|nr:mechanosensitive ion channel [Leptolyngbya sp. SIO3F4]